jgi:hypothetical protein
MTPGLGVTSARLISPEASRWRRGGDRRDNEVVEALLRVLECHRRPRPADDWLDGPPGRVAIQMAATGGIVQPRSGDDEVSIHTARLFR